VKSSGPASKCSTIRLQGRFTCGGSLLLSW
jgi:hypothetical protein